MRRDEPRTDEDDRPDEDRHDRNLPRQQKEEQRDSSQDIHEREQQAVQRSRKPSIESSKVDREAGKEIGGRVSRPKAGREILATLEERFADLAQQPSDGARVEPVAPNRQCRSYQRADREDDEDRNERVRVSRNDRDVDEKLVAERQARVEQTVHQR